MNILSISVSTSLSGHRSILYTRLVLLELQASESVGYSTQQQRFDPLKEANTDTASRSEDSLKLLFEIQSVRGYSGM